VGGPRDVEGIAALFKERRFAAGETVTKEGAGGAAFFLIESGEAIVSVGGRQRSTLTKGDYFGQMALIDEGARSATITAHRAHVPRGSPTRSCGRSCSRPQLSPGT